MERISKLANSMVSTESDIDHYDVVVIGGGSGGLSVCKQMALGPISVALFDFVEPSVKGSVWGLGGTCPNVGCIPKKLFHEAGVLVDILDHLNDFGIYVEKPKVDFEKLTNNIQSHIKSLNFQNEEMLRNGGIKYFNEKATFLDSQTIISSKYQNVIDSILKGEKVSSNSYRVISLLIRIQTSRYCYRRKTSNAKDFWN